MSDENGTNGYGSQPQQPAGSPWAPAPPIPPAPRRDRRGGVTAGVILIAVGAVFLAGQMIPGVAWWNLWPLLVVLGGVVQMFTPDHRDTWTVWRIFEGLGTVLVGVVLLGNALGVVSWGVWWTFIMLWPALVIALGVSVLGRGLHQMWLRGAGTLIVWLTLAYAVAVSVTGVGGLTPIQPWTRAATGVPFSYSEPAGALSTGTLTFKGGAGDISIRSGSDLVTASGTTPFGQPQFDVVRSADHADVALTLGTSDRTVVAPGFGSGQADIALSDAMVWDATLDTGASRLDADFSDMQIRRLVLDSGVDQSTLKLGEVPTSLTQTDVIIKSGLSDVSILVPKDAAVHINTHNGLVSTNIDPHFEPKAAGVYETPDATTAQRVINISIDSGISSVSVKTY